jgi:hypothetical protein
MVDGEPPTRPAHSMAMELPAGTSNSPEVASPAPTRARSLTKALAVLEVFCTATEVKTRPAGIAEPVSELVMSVPVTSVQSVEAFKDVSSVPV